MCAMPFVKLTFEQGQTVSVWSELNTDCIALSFFKLLKSVGSPVNFERCANTDCNKLAFNAIQRSPKIPYTGNITKEGAHFIQRVEMLLKLSQTSDRPILNTTSKILENGFLYIFALTTTLSFICMSK